jgi:hypothetical protein
VERGLDRVRAGGWSRRLVAAGRRLEAANGAGEGAAEARAEYERLAGLAEARLKRLRFRAEVLWRVAECFDGPPPGEAKAVVRRDWSGERGGGVQDAGRVLRPERVPAGGEAGAGGGPGAGGGVPVVRGLWDGWGEAEPAGVPELLSVYLPETTGYHVSGIDDPFRPKGAGTLPHPRIRLDGLTQGVVAVLGTGFGQRCPGPVPLWSSRGFAGRISAPSRSQLPGRSVHAKRLARLARPGGSKPPGGFGSPQRPPRSREAAGEHTSGANLTCSG